MLHRGDSATLLFRWLVGQQKPPGTHEEKGVALAHAKFFEVLCGQSDLLPLISLFESGECVYYVRQGPLQQRGQLQPVQQLTVQPPPPTPTHRPVAVPTLSPPEVYDLAAIIRQNHPAWQDGPVAP